MIGGEILPWKNQIAFENKVANMRTQQYLSSPENCICFFDRSALDCIAYLKLNNLNATSEIINLIQKCKFNNTVFYTPIWKNIFVNDNERKEDIKFYKKGQEVGMFNLGSTVILLTSKITCDWSKNIEINKKILIRDEITR